MYLCLVLKLLCFRSVRCIDRRQRHYVMSVHSVSDSVVVLTKAVMHHLEPSGGCPETIRHCLDLSGSTWKHSGNVHPFQPNLLYQSDCHSCFTSSLRLKSFPWFLCGTVDCCSTACVSLVMPASLHVVQRELDVP